MARLAVIANAPCVVSAVAIVDTQSATVVKSAQIKKGYVWLSAWDTKATTVAIADACDSLALVRLDGDHVSEEMVDFLSEMMCEQKMRVLSMAWRTGQPQLLLAVGNSVGDIVLFLADLEHKCIVWQKSQRMRTFAAELENLVT